MPELKVGDVCEIINVAFDDFHFDEKEELIGKRVTITEYRHTWKDGSVACQVKLGDMTFFFRAVTLKKINNKSG